MSGLGAGFDVWRRPVIDSLCSVISGNSRPRFDCVFLVWHSVLDRRRSFTSSPLVSGGHDTIRSPYSILSSLESIYLLLIDPFSRKKNVDK